MRTKIFLLIASKVFLISAILLLFEMTTNIASMYSFSGQQESVQISNKGDVQTTMVNDIIFHDENHTKQAYGNGFLISHDQDTFAITAKHILTLVKTERMKTVNLGKEIKEWRMYPKDSKSEYVVMDKLLNTSNLDSLSWDFMSKIGDAYADWLVFSIKENNSKIVPLKIRNTPLVQNEILYANGWTFEDNEKQPRYKYEYYGEAGASFTMKALNARENEFGLSGSPVVDSRNLLVGIVSMAIRDSLTGLRLNAPSKIDHLKKILIDITHH